MILASHPSPAESQPDPLGRVLIVDDDDLIAASLRHVLMQKGCDVDVARDRRFAEELLASREYGLVVVDPYLTGEADDAGKLLPMIRSHQPETSIVVLSAYGASEVVSAPSFRTTIVRKPQPLSFLARLVVALLHTASAQPSAPEWSEKEIREVE
jgi:DNA-binding NtrC family response regulator